MAKRARQRISYVLERADKQSGGHIKGVNGLAVDRERSILYSGGRDGILCAWDLNLDLSGNASPSAADSTSAASSARNTTKFRTQHLAHTNWICDLALVQNNEAVVTASQDQLVKLWRPHASQAEEPVKIGEHADYAKCVASPSANATWVATGGLDRKVYVWDLNGGGKTQEIDTRGEEKPEKGSIYSLSATENVLAYGGLESILHLWDTRSGKRITEFRGHTGLVRSILLSASGDTVITGSSDQTVKIWSVTAGRCMHTLTMHNESVFSLYSEEPDLSVFYSADRSGLVVKTDIRDVEVDDGLALAVAHEHDIVNRLVAAGDHIWTATQRSSINRWQNVDTRTDVALPESFRQHRASVSSNAPPSTNGDTPSASTKTIPAKSILRISNTAHFPVPQSELDPLAPEPVSIVEPIRMTPRETIEGQFGLVKHRLLADKRRVLTLDTAGDVLLWDLIQCKPIQSFGKKHLEDVEPLVNTLENVSPWCSVDTSSGNLTVILEPFNCFDAEMYADELELEEPLKFRDDQRINYGKWILRYLFANLIDEEIRRDETYRSKLNEAVELRVKSRPAPTITIPSNTNFESAIESPLISRINGPQFVQGTPTGMGIGLATPNVPGMRDENVGPGSPLDKRGPTQAEDYFSNAINAVNSGQAAKPAAAPATPAEAEDKTAKSEDGKDAKEKDKGDSKAPFGKKFRMGMSFGTKKLGRSGSATVADKPAVTEEKTAESESSSNHEPEKEYEDNLLGVVQKIQNDYEKQVTESPEKHVETKITPSLPNETPILNIPVGTKVIIQEETSGGSAELYRGTVESVGPDADDIEKCAPQWLGEVLLLNTIPPKDPVKVSFVLNPYPDSDLPVLASADGNNRLNANRMLRVKKILAYVAERIDPTMAPTAEGEEDNQPEPDPDALKPEEYLELYCNEQLLPHSMTLATLRAYIWKGGNDVVLYYKDNGKKEIPRAAPELSPTTASNGEQTSTNVDEAGDAQPAAGV
ncbi:WD repeat protein-like protein [Coniella lustricola]|uniref:WD repeat protein-like protein n=1 Tax=Coniella lustricola TaxID=2025994 RepID=A0A2T3AGQ8_9PEZI|nr:WD repeat protein-like protein [Coniella lustricola]